MEAFISILNALSGTLVATVSGVLIIAFAKSIIKIFNLGVTFKTNLATKEEQEEFEDKMRKEMLAWKEEIERTVLSIALRTIERELRNVDKISETATDIKITEENLKNKIADLEEKYTELKDAITTLNTLKNTVQRLEYTRDMSSGERRSE